MLPEDRSNLGRTKSSLSLYYPRQNGQQELLLLPLAPQNPMGVMQRWPKWMFHRRWVCVTPSEPQYFSNHLPYQPFPQRSGNKSGLSSKGRHYPKYPWECSLGKNCTKRYWNARGISPQQETGGYPKPPSNLGCPPILQPDKTIEIKTLLSFHTNWVFL